MGKCKECGKHGLFLKLNSDGLCEECELKVSGDKNEKTQFASDISHMSCDKLAENLANDIKYNTGFTDELDKYNAQQEEKSRKERKEFDQIYEKYETAHDLEKRGKFEEALSLYLEIVKKNPDGTAYFDRPCIVLEKVGRYDEAIALCNQALERISSGKMSADPESYRKRISRLEKKKSK